MHKQSENPILARLNPDSFKKNTELYRCSVNLPTLFHMMKQKIDGKTSKLQIWNNPNISELLIMNRYL